MRNTDDPENKNCKIENNISGQFCFVILFTRIPQPTIKITFIVNCVLGYMTIVGTVPLSRKKIEKDNVPTGMIAIFGLKNWHPETSI